MPRKDIIDVLESKMGITDLPIDPIDLYRKSMMEFLTEFPSYQRQMSCDMTCWRCSAARAVSCATLNCEEDLIDKVRNGVRPGGD